MTARDRTDTPDDPRMASDKLGDMIAGARITQIVYVAAKLGVADALADGPLAAPDLAANVGAEPRAFYRLMRALAGQGVFVQRDDGRFQLEERSELLRSDVSGSLRPSAIMAGEPWFYGAYGHLLHSIKTAQTAFDHLFGVGLFDYLKEHPDEAAVFNDAMSDFSRQVINDVVEAYDFSGVRHIVDVGGGHGTLLAAVLSAHPTMQGTLFDRAEVLAGAPEVLSESGVEERCDLAAGDFFKSVPSGGDAYMMKWIIHDWDDERCIAILKNCRSAMGQDGRLLLIEREMPAGNDPSPGTIGDITMMVIPGGQERTRDEFRSILDAAGFRLANIHPTQSEVSIFEALPH